MKIRRLEIQGFKSFVDRTVLDFQDGITGVVGPNGCGKSNIVDAIRWAMGEQSAKTLRGRAMEDIIFGGSESRKPHGRAEVSLVFSNEDGRVPPAWRDFPEIMITRRLYRTGESEYLINKTPCRLLDITELFMDTGAGSRAYAVVEQGRIGSILSARPEERRSLIEEAAGVTKYKSRRKAAERKMEATRQNLLRLSDVVAEVRRQTNSLKRQAQKAEQFRDLRQQARELEVQLAGRDYSLRSEELFTVRAEVVQQEEALGEALGRLEQQELRQEEVRLALAAREQEYQQGQQRLFHLGAEVQRVEGELALGEREREGLIRQRERLQAEQAEAVDRFAEMEQEEQSLHQLATGIERELAEEERLLQVQQAEFDRLGAEERELTTKLDQARSALFGLMKEQGRLSNRAQEVGQRLATLDDRTARLRAETVGARERIAEVALRREQAEVRLQSERQHLQGLQDQREEYGERLASLRAAVDQAGGRVLQCQGELSHAASRLDSLQQLERSGEGLDEGLQRLLQQDRFRRVLAESGADLVEVPEALERAVESVLGARLQARLAPVAGDALDALATLRQQGGRGLFLLPEARPLPVELPAGAQPLFAALKPRPGREARAAALFEGVGLVETLEPFLGTPLAAGAVLVTRAGDWLSGRGEVGGGTAAGPGAGVLQRRREIRQLEQECQRLRQTLADEESRLQQSRDTIAETEEARAELAPVQQRFEQQLLELEKERARLLHEEEQLGERLELFQYDEEQLHEERESLLAEQRQLEQERADDERSQFERQEQVELLQEQVQVQRRELDGLREQVTSRRVTVAGLGERQAGSRRALEQLQAQRVNLQQRQAQLTQALSQGEADLQGLEQRKTRQRAELDVLLRRRGEEELAGTGRHDACEQCRQQLEQEQETGRSVRSQAERLRETVTGLQLRERELALELEHLRQGVLERHRLDLADGCPSAPTDWDEERARRQLRDLNERISDMGEVNLTAIDEFRELEERHGFLISQQEDLQRSLEELQQAIARINRTTRQRFKETFEQVNAKFQELFPRLFRGGRATLELTDVNDMLETGVEIVVQPPGKRLQNVNLLSGGEKALTAVALIFALFSIRPSPFCLLDEVDAPLDDANIGRFADMIREMSLHTQFIVITHNKQTMAGADVMYGVTMEEPGVSKIVSVRMSAA